MAVSSGSRLDKQRERQRIYRERVKADRRPSRDDIARALLYWAVTENLKRGREEAVGDIQDHIVAQLVDQGFDKRAADNAFEDLVDRYRHGWKPQTKPHLKQRRRGTGEQPEADDA